VRRYVQGHVIDSPASNDLAKKLNLAGFAVLSFETLEDREHAYTSPRIRECDKDSEQFVGAVSRVVTESHIVKAPPEKGSHVKAYIFKVGRAGEDTAWSDSAEARVTKLPGVSGYVRHKVRSQAGAPGSKVPVLDLPVAGIAEVWFESQAALLQNAGALAEAGGDPANTAVYVARDHRLI
jgi:hypothetical protein